MAIEKKHLNKITDYIWEIPKSFRSDMRVPARVYVTEQMLDDLLGEKSLEQLVNVTALPGILKAALVMPDVHEGYGFPIGGVAAMEYPDGVISPGGIGYDINCGVRLLRSEVTFDQIKDDLPKLAKAIYKTVPSGIGKGGSLKLSDTELDEVLATGLKWAVKKGYASEKDAVHVESYGSLPNADPAAVSGHAKNRGRGQLGTLGAGNHFVEVERVEKIFDREVASAFGLFEGQVTILIHCGSRGLGHQVATDYIRLMLNKLSDYKISLPDRELSCAPFSSAEGTNYFNAMAAAANFAWTNRQLITQEVRQAWEVLGKSTELSILYDVAHNIAKIETHTLTNTDLTRTSADSQSLSVSGQKKSVVIVHRKGATRAFPSGHPELMGQFQKVGQPVIIPGSMGTGSYVLVGTESAMSESFGSSCHGAGRRMSRHAALRTVQGKKLKEELKQAGIFVEAGSVKGLAEEAPVAYKSVDEVVEVVASAGLARKVARLRPLAVVKG